MAKCFWWPYNGCMNVLHLVKDKFQPAGPLPYASVFGAKGLQLTAKLSLFLLDKGKFLELTLML